MYLQLIRHVDERECGECSMVTERGQRPQARFACSDHGDPQESSLGFVRRFRKGKILIMIHTARDATNCLSDYGSGALEPLNSASTSGRPSCPRYVC